MVAAPQLERLILFGAGGLGRKVLQGIRANGIDPLAFCDNNQNLWDESIQGVPVLAPSEAASEFGTTAVFVVCIWHPSKRGMRHHVEQLQKAGCKTVIAFTEVFMQFPETFLPSGLFQMPIREEQWRREIDQAAALFQGWDRDEYERQLRLRFAGEILGLTESVSGVQYFPADPISLSDREVFVDCGAHNGDTLEDFLSVSGGRFEKVIALEPDSNNFRALQSKSDDPRITTYPLAVGDKTEMLRFDASGTEGSRITSEGNSYVLCIRLDELLAEETPTYIKMDIEGAEPRALLGAKETIRRCRPKLAVCVYHEPEHLWTIPLLMKELQPAANLYLRPHLADGWDLVCYSIPLPDER